MFTWAPLTTPWDGAGAQGFGCIRLPSGRQLIGGFTFSGPEQILVSDDDGANWTPVSSPFDGGSVAGFAFSQPLGVLVAMGLSADSLTTIAYSTDGGDTWISAGDPFGTNGQCCAWDNGEAMFVAGAYASASTVIATSPDGAVWTPQVTPMDGGGGGNGFVMGIIRSQILGEWVACGQDGSNNGMAMRSANAIAWTAASVGPFGNNGIANGIAEDTSAGLICVTGATSTTSETASTSTDADIWADRNTPFDLVGPGNGVIGAPGRLLAVGTSGAIESGDGGLTWTDDPDSLFASGGDGYGICFTTNATHALAVGYNAAQTLVADAGAGGYTPIPPPPIAYARVYGIQITLSDDGVEQVSALVLSPDGFTA